MGGFKFQPVAKEKFSITNENDELIKEYEFDFGSEDYLRALTEKGKKILDGSKDLSNGNLDELKNSMKEYIDFILGAKEFDFLYEKFNKNLFAMIQLIAAIFAIGKKRLTDKLQEQIKFYE